MWEEQIELQKFQKFQFHKSLLEEQLYTIEKKHSGLVRFIDKQRLYSCLFPQNTPLQVKLISTHPHDSFQQFLASIINSIVNKLIDENNDQTSEILSQFNLLKTTLSIEFTGKVSDGGFSLYSNNELDINLFDPLMTFNIMRDITSTLINFSTEPSIHFASNSPYGKATNRIQDYIIKNKSTRSNLVCSIDNEYLNLIFNMKSFLNDYDVVVNYKNNELAQHLQRSNYLNENSQQIHKLLNLDSKVINIGLCILISELKSASSSVNNALSYLKKHRSKLVVASRFYEKIKSNKHIDDNRDKEIILRYLSMFICRNTP